MNEGEKALGAAAGGGMTDPIAGYTAPTRYTVPTPGEAERIDLGHSDNGFNYSGEDSLGRPVKGFVQTTEQRLAENELEHAGIRVHTIMPRRGVRKKSRKPTGIEFATLAEQFGDLMEVGQSPTQICRLLAYAQTNQMLADALLDAAELVINGRSLSEAFAAQRDPKGEPLFPITFICALRIGEEVGTASDQDTGEVRRTRSL